MCNSIPLLLFVNIISSERFYIYSLIVNKKLYGFFYRIDVDLFVSSVEGVTAMKSIQEEQYEYDKFMLELAHKAQEVQQDYNKLSDENKCRVKNELEKTLAVRGLAGVLQHIKEQI